MITALRLHFSHSLTLLALIVACWISGVTAAPVQSQPALWLVQKGDARIYLFGSVHFGREDFYPLPAVVDQAFINADVLVVEVDILNLNPASAERALLKYGRLPPGEALVEHLPKDLRDKLALHLEKTGIPLAAFTRFQPWFAALQLAEYEVRQTGLQQTLGLDLHFLSRNAQSPLPRRVMELESLESQLGLFGDLSMAQQVEFLRQTLEDLSHSQDYLEDIALAWRSGNLARLEKLLIEPFRNQPETQVLFEKIFTQRNIKMVEHLRRLLNESHQVFFVVGAGHMVGKEGIISLLEQQGFTARRLPTDTIQ